MERVLEGRRPQRPATPLQQRKLVLVVEDDTATRAVVRSAVEEEFPSVHVIEAADGEEAVRRAQRELPDLVLLNLLLPKVNGLEVVHLLRSHHATRETPIVLMSGSTRHLEMAVELHCDGIIEKPFDLGTLFSTVEPFVQDEQPSA